MSGVTKSSLNTYSLYPPLKPKQSQDIERPPTAINHSRVDSLNHPTDAAPAPTIKFDRMDKGKQSALPETMSPLETPLSTRSHLLDLASPDAPFTSDDDTAPPPPDFTRRGIHIPTRTSSMKKIRRRRRDLGSSAPTTPDSRQFSEGASILSFETKASSIHTLPPLQAKGNETEHLEPLLEDDPRSFDLVAPTNEELKGVYSLERRSEQLFSREHLQVIFDDPSLLLKFTSFLGTHRPQSIPLLIYYLDALKALRAINYANAIAEALEPLQGFDFTEHPARTTVNSVLESKASQAFDALVRDELPAYVTYVWIQVVSLSIQRRITGTLPPHLREASEGLAEVFCLTDPSRPDNPIVFASEEFHRTTQYGVNYAVGRNCRFLQGPRTNPFSTKRIKKAVQECREHSEVFLNYRRDGSPFMNLLMIAPLMDSKGTVRYFIGAQVDVSGLVKECTDLEGLQRLLAKEERPEDFEEEKKDEFQELSEMLNMTELETVRKYGGRMHKEQIEEDDQSVLGYHRPRLLLNDPTADIVNLAKTIKSVKNGRLEGVYQNYLLVRPYPSLRILFTSPSLRVPGILQSPFLSRIGGSSRVRDELTAALATGRGVTAKIRWMTRNDEEGRKRWIHCTPLLGHNGNVGVWMVVLVDEEGANMVKRFRQAPPVSNTIGSADRGKENRRPMQDDYYTTMIHRATGAGKGYDSRPGTALSDRINYRQQRAATPNPDSEQSFNI